MESLKEVLKRITSTEETLKQLEEALTLKDNKIALLRKESEDYI